MYEVKDWNLKVFEQKKTEKAVVMNCAKSGRKKEDGSGYKASMYINVILNDETDWPHEDMTGKNIDVAGRFTHDEWEKDGKKGLNFTIFADKVTEHVWETDNSKGNHSKGGNRKW